MTRLAIYDPPLCCSSGVCGPTVDPVLPRVAADLDWLKRQGVQVERYNLAQQAHAFATNPVVSAELQQHGNDCLPLVLVDGHVALRSTYPSREELARLAGVAAAGHDTPAPAAEACCAPAAAPSTSCCEPAPATSTSCCAPAPSASQGCCEPTPWWREEPGKGSCC